MEISSSRKARVREAHAFLGTLTYDSALEFTLWRSTLSDNRAEGITGAGEGGALRLSAEGAGSVLRGELANSTLSGNQSFSTWGLGRGGAVSIARLTPGAEIRASISSSTVTQNLASTMGGGLDLDDDWRGRLVDLHLRNTILAENDAAVWSDCATSPPRARLVSDGYILVGTTRGCHLQNGDGDLVGVDPRLGPLASNGMTIRTHALLSDSPPSMPVTRTAAPMLRAWSSKPTSVDSRVPIAATSARSSIDHDVCLQSHSEHRPLKPKPPVSTR